MLREGDNQTELILYNSLTTTFRTVISRQILAISPIAICDVPRTHPSPARWGRARGRETIDERRAET